MKFKQAREMVGMTREELAEWLHWPYVNYVSKYESGARKGVPDEFIEFLVEKGFDLNSFFDSSIKELRFLTDIQQNILGEPSVPYKKCKQCEEYKAELKVLRDQLKTICEVVQGKVDSPKKRKVA